MTTKATKPKRETHHMWALYDDEGEMIYSPFRVRRMARETAKDAGLRVVKVKVTITPQ